MKGFIYNLPWRPSWLECGALINDYAPGCGTLVVRGPTGHKKEGFHPGVSCTNGCLAESAYISTSTSLSTAS